MVVAHAAGVAVGGISHQRAEPQAFLTLPDIRRSLPAMGRSDFLKEAFSNAL